MILGILRETKKGENRVICTPKEVETITSAGHTVYAQRGCGERAGFSDEAYESAGALLTDSVQELFKVCDMVAKVKEFTPEEWPRPRQALLTGTYCGGIAENRYRFQLCQMAEGEQRVPHHPKHAFPHGKGLSDRGYFQRRAGSNRDQPRDHA